MCECVHTYSVCMALRDEKVPLAMVWSLLSYSDSRLRLWRSWNASTRRHAILLAFSNLKWQNKGERERVGEMEMKAHPVIVLWRVFQMVQVSEDGFQSWCLNSDDNVWGKHFSAEYRWDANATDFVLVCVFLLTVAAEKTAPQRVLWRSLWFCSHIVPCRKQMQH